MINLLRRTTAPLDGPIDSESRDSRQQVDTLGKAVETIGKKTSRDQTLIEGLPRRAQSYLPNR